MRWQKETFTSEFVWYLNAFDENNDDGSFIDYAEMRGCNEGLYFLLQSVLQSGKRNLTLIEQSGILPPRTRFFSDPLPVNPQRQGWLAAAAEAVAAADVVFLDPDNGLTESPDAYRRKTTKIRFYRGGSVLSTTAPKRSDLPASDKKRNL